MGRKSANTDLRRSLNLKDIKPKTDNQEQAFCSYFQNQNLFLCGVTGTGKTYIALYLALNDLIRGEYNKIMIVRSMVQTRDIGFLPGTYEEKLRIYENPYEDMVNDLTERGDSYATLKKKGLLQFMSTSYVRGLTFNKTLMILDEAQNLTWHEIMSVLTRLGEKSRIIICGDLNQDDLSNNSRRRDVTGFQTLCDVVKCMKTFDIIEFSKNDIVRSGFTKDFIVACIHRNVI